MKKILSSFLILLVVGFFGLSSVKANSNHELVEVNDLPETTASFFDLEGQMGEARFQVDLNKVTIRVSYEQEDYYIEMFMSKETDMSIFTEYIEAFYYTADGEKFIVINIGDYSFFDKNGDVAEVFNPHLIWNLNKNEYERFDKFQTYLYTELEDANNAYAYFYVDQFMIDNLLSATLRYRYKYLNLFNKPSGDWKEKGVILEDKMYAETDKLSWQVKYMSGTMLASQALMFVPGMQLPSLIIGSALLLGINELQQSSGVNLTSIEQIEKVIPNARITNKLDNAYYNQDPNFDGIQKGYNVFKLHLGQFNKSLTRGVVFDEEYSHVEGQKGINIVEFTYMTNGEIYTQKGGNINVVWEAGPGTTAPDNNNYTTLIVVGIIAAVGLMGIKSGAFKSYKNLANFIIAVGIFSVLGYIVYEFVINNVLFWYRL